MDLHPGDLLLFRRLTFKQAWRAQRWRGLATWLGNWAIALAQLMKSSGPQPDGFWQYVHVGVLINYRDRRLLCLEFTAGRPGMRLRDASERIASYPGAVDCQPLSGRYHWHNDWAADWIGEHEQDGYRWLGLLFAVTGLFSGWRSPGAMFCSEAVVAICLDQRIIPDDLTVLRGGRLRRGMIEPQTYSPAECARLPQWKRNSAYSAKE